MFHGILWLNMGNTTYATYQSRNTTATTATTTTDYELRRSNT